MRSRMLTVGVLAALTAALVATTPAAAEPASHDLYLATPVSSDGTTADPALLAALTDQHVSPAQPPSALSHSTGADLTPPAAVESPVTANTAPGIESIIGTDDRYRITPTTWYPASATVFLSRTQGGVTGRWCTGWMVSPDTVITAGHCVHTGGPGGSWIPSSQLLAWPGRDGDVAPYGSCTVSSLHSVLGWTQNADDRYDYGALKLNCTVGYTTGWYGFMWPEGSLTGVPTYNMGYGQDKPFGTQWETFDRITVTEPMRLFYQHDTIGGHSGGPVYTYTTLCGGPCGLAVHAYGTYGSPPFSNNNHGTRITEAVFNNFIYWISLPW